MKRFKFLIPVLLSTISFHFSSAQNNYLTHTLKQGETLSALAKQYNTNVGDIMRLNGMHADSKLVYGSKIKIPATHVQQAEEKKNIVQQQPAFSSEKPLLHKVTQGETLYSIAKKYNVSTEQLRSWNHMSDGNVKLGANLIVGSNADVAYKPVLQQETIEPAKQEEKIVPTETQHNEEAKNEIPGNGINASVKEEASTIEKPAIVNDPPASSENREGFFADQFQNKKSKRLHTASGLSKTFKTASGWNDGKYYILANDINPGTIVRVTADNGKTVYAKVLWDMGSLKENAGLNFRISNAAAAALNEDSGSFNLNVSY